MPIASGALHIEPGIWLHVPATTDPPVANATVVRQATIPHGDSLLAIGKCHSHGRTGGRRSIRWIRRQPRTHPALSLGLGYLDPFINPVLPPGFKARIRQEPEPGASGCDPGRELS